MPDSENGLDSLAVSLSGPALSCCGKPMSHCTESTRCSLISSCSIPVQQRLNLAQWYWILVPAFFPVCCCSSKELAEGLLYHIWSVDTCSSAGLEHCRSFHLEKYGSPSCLLLPLPTENLPFVFPDSGPNKIHQNNTGDTEGISCLKLGLGATHATISCLTMKSCGWNPGRVSPAGTAGLPRLLCKQVSPCLWWPLTLFSC